MNLQIKAMLASFAICVVLGIIVIPILRKFKIGQVVRDDGPKSHLSKNGTPTMGGLIILAAITITSIAVSFKYPNILPVMFVTLGYGLVGFIDDFIKLILKNPKGLLPKYKMLGLILFATAFVVYLVYSGFGTDTYLPIFKTYITLPDWIYIPCAVFIILACTNSLNLSDGLDGLAAGITAIIMTFFTVVAIIYGNKEITAFSAATVGACIGFLVFNLKPAKTFMGDTGSLALGGAFCSVALMLKMPLILVVVAGICVVEAISVMLQIMYFRKTGGKRLFKMAPIHHHLELSGYDENDIVILFWGITVLLAIISFIII
jgi:phospho-N-acetylmuramoyl-pentapeptide-transferase